MSIEDEKLRLYEDAQHISDFIHGVEENMHSTFRSPRNAIETCEEALRRSALLTEVLSSISCQNATDFGLHGKNEAVRAHISGIVDSILPRSEEITGHLTAAAQILKEVDTEYSKFGGLFMASDLMERMRNLRAQANDL